MNSRDEIGYISILYVGDGRVTVGLNEWEQLVAAVQDPLRRSRYFECTDEYGADSLICLDGIRAMYRLTPDVIEAAKQDSRQSRIEDLE